MTGLLEGILRKPRSVLTMMLVMVAAGIMTYITIPKEADPDIDVPVFYVSIVLQGVSPEDSERLLVRPMEQELRGLEGVKNITSVASQGHAGIVVEFDIEVDQAEAGTDLREKVDRARAELPSSAEEPTVTETNLSLFPVILVALSGDVPERTLYRSAKRIQDQIETIPTVLEAKLVGHREEVWEVLIDTARLEALGLTPQAVFDAVSRNNRLVPAGGLATAQGRFEVKVPGLFETVEDVRQLPLKVNDLGIVTIGDIAELRPTFKDPVSFSRFNGKPAIAIEVVKRTGTNIVENNAQVRAVVAEATKDWPDKIEVSFALDTSKSIFEVLGSLEAAIITAIALVMILVVAALGLRSALLVGVAIPSSFMIGFLIIGMLGMTVNTMLMFGMVLTVGILVDGAIVIVEYADRKMKEGLVAREAYILAAKRMFLPIASSTATTLAAFLPMLLWPGVPGKFMSYLPITVIIVLTASLITAMIFLPVLGGLLGGRSGTGAERITLTNVRGVTGAYVAFLRAMIWRPLFTTVTAAILVAGSFFAYGQMNSGVEFFVETEPEQALAFVSARGNLSAREELALVREVEERVLQVPGIASVFTTTGSGGGGSELGSGATDAPADRIGQLTLELGDYATRRKGKVILADVRDRLADIPGIRTEVRKREDGPSQGKAIRLEIGGTDRALVQEVTGRVRAHFDTNITGLVDVEDSRPLPGIEWVITVDRREAGRYGTDVASVGAMIQLVTDGVLTGTSRPDTSDDEIDIRLRLPESDRSIDQLDVLRIQTPNGLVPLANLVTRTARQRVSLIERRNGRTVMNVKANVADGILADDKLTEIRTWLAQETWPDEIAFTFRGADEEQKESGQFLGLAMVGALFMMFIILVTQFNSFSQALITLSTIVLSIAGVLVGMLLTGQKFSIIMTGTGVVALAGIVVNNSIVLIDTFNRLCQEGVDRVDAVLLACAQRFRPVLLTTVTTIFGLLPMANQVNVDFFTPSILIGSVTSVWWVQLSTAIISGLTFATLITLVLTPALLAWPSVYARRWRAMRGAPASRSAAAPAAGSAVPAE